MGHIRIVVLCRAASVMCVRLYGHTVPYRSLTSFLYRSYRTLPPVFRSLIALCIISNFCSTGWDLPRHDCLFLPESGPRIHQVIFFSLPKVLRGVRVLDSHHLNVDPDPAFHFNPDPDPVPHQGDANLRPLVYRPTTVYVGLHFEPPRPSFELQWPSAVPFWASKDPKFRLYCGSGSSFQTNRDPDPKPCWCPRFFTSTDNFPGFVTSDVVDDHQPLW